MIHDFGGEVGWFNIAPKVFFAGIHCASEWRAIHGADYLLRGYRQSSILKFFTILRLATRNQTAVAASGIRSPIPRRAARVRVMHVFMKSFGKYCDKNFELSANP